MSKRVDFSHVDVDEVLHIPVRCLGIYHINCDTFSVDARRARRHIRKARKRECHPQLRDWWRRRLNAMERRL